jgi:hypothetical protein
MFRRALLLIVLALVGTACDLPDPAPECWEEERCERETDLCLDSCRAPNAVKICPQCCMDMLKKCKICKGPYQFDKCD